MRSRTGRNLAWTTLSLLGSKGAMFASLIIIARAISPGQFGDYVVTVAMASILMPVLDGGFVSSVTRAASRRQDVPALSFTATAARMRLPLWGCVLILGFACGLLGLAVHVMWFAAIVLMAVLLGLIASQLRGPRGGGVVSGVVSTVIVEAKSVGEDIARAGNPQSEPDSDAPATPSE